MSFGVGYLEHLMNTRISPTALVRAGYLTAASAGIDSFWLPDHLNNLVPRGIGTSEYIGAARMVPDVDAYLEPWTMLGRISGWSRLSRLRLGVGVTDAGRRNPAVTAQAAATLHLLTRGRAILGIGVGEREGNQPYGVDWIRPVARFEEALATIRALWNSGGGLISRDSEFFPLRNAIFTLPPYRGKWPEIWVAAHGPRMLRATGRYADAWFPATVFRPQDYEERLDLVRSAASDAGRVPTSVLPAVGLIMVTGRTRDDVDEAIDSPAVRSMALCVPDSDWARHGAQHPLGKGFSGLQDVLPQTMDQQTVLSYAAQVPGTLLREVFLTGTPEEIIDRVAVWRDHGAQYASILNLSGLQPSLRKGLTATGLPTLAVLRGLKKL
jgi:phthiodiolone/phenolphthiodiolone dimycocerosates ketoreductase